jgi:large subunit ribosomal protein L15e
VKIRRGDRKKKVSKGIVYGKPSSQGVNKQKSTRSLRAIAESRVGRRINSMRVLNSYWVGQDAMHKWFEVIMVDHAHPEIREDARLNWICNAKHKHREQRGKTSAGRKSRGLHKKGSHHATRARPSRRANWKRRQMLSLRRYR